MPSPPSRFTLLIPTYNRSAYLRSQVAYLTARRVEFPIHVLYSSPEPALSENRGMISRAGLDITHKIYDPTITIWTKLARGIEAIETPYSSFCADDDVLFTGVLNECLDFLDANPTFVAAHGYYINFKPG